MPLLLTIYTPTLGPKRPRSLIRCLQSVAQQANQNLQHLLILDYIGIGNIGVNKAIADNHGAIRGEYVYILSDDDVLSDPQIVSDFQDFVRAESSPDVVMCRQTIGGKLLPPDTHWEQPPVICQISGGCWFVKREVWIAHPWGARREGDFDFISAVFDTGRYRIAWWNRIVATAPDGERFGKAE